MLMVPFVAVAADESIMFELGFGFGNSGKVTKTAEELANPFNNKFCYHRPSSRMIYGAVRYRYDDVEAHVARWVNDSDQARCDRDSWAVGMGYVIDTQTGSGTDSVDDVYASWTPGLAYTFGANKDFNVQDNSNTNWRLKDNFQMYNRVAIGVGDKDYAGEVAIVRYGMIASDYERKGENFMTISAGVRDFDSPSDGSRGLEQPPIINEGDNITNINITDNSVTNITVPADFEQVAPTPPVEDTPPPPAPE